MMRCWRARSRAGATRALRSSVYAGTVCKIEKAVIRQAGNGFFIGSVDELCRATAWHAAQSRLLFDLEYSNRISQTFGLLIERTRRGRRLLD